MKRSFFVRVLLVALGLAAAAVGVANLTFLFTARQVVLQGLREEAERLAVSAAGRIETSRYRALLEGRLEASQAFAPIQEELRALRAELGPSGVENLYTLMVRNGKIYVVGDPAPDAGLPLKAEDTQGAGLKKRVFATGVPASTEEPYSDQYGTWISGYAPITEAGQVIALIGADLPLGAFPLMDRIIRRNVLVSLVPALVVAAGASLYMSRRLTDPVRRITRSLKRVEAGELAVEIEVASEDEFGRMAQAFNEMTRGLREKERIRSVLQQAVSKEIAEEMLRDGVPSAGELVEATVLFADIRGFTTLSERIRAREVITLVNEYLETLVPAVIENGGLVDKFVGDEVFAVFGTPVPLEDDALAAVRAALAMRSRLEELNRRRVAEGRPRIEIGIGINTGTVVAGAVGTADRRNYTVLGAAVNEGARLCGAARAGQILISRSTFVRVQHHVEARELPPLLAKNITLPLVVFEVLGLRRNDDA